MPGEESSYQLLVEVDGHLLQENVAALLASGYIDNRLNWPDMAVLRFTDDGSGVLDKGGFQIGAEMRVLVQKSGGDGPKPLTSAEITAVEAELDSSGMHLVIRGLDKSHRLFRGKRTQTFLQMTPSDIAKKIAQLAGLATGQVDSFNPVLAHTGQNGISDWEFLHNLADQVGAELSVLDGKLNFRKPTDAGAAPSTQQESKQNPFVIERGVNLVALRATVTATDQVPSVEVRGWDVGNKRALVGSSTVNGTTSAKLDTTGPDQLASKMHSIKWIESVSSYGQQEQCKNRAGAIANRLAGSFAELDGVVRGNPEIRAGKAVALSRVGKPFDGKYTLSSTRHEFSPEIGYLTEFTVSNASECASLYGLIAGEAPRRRGQVIGVMPGLVTDTKDPESSSRVKVKLPLLADDYESWWVRTVQSGAGSQRGAIVLPEVGDEVLLAFGMGDIDEPYILGGLYNGRDLPAKGSVDPIGKTDGKVQRRVFVSRTGMAVEYIETPQDEKLTLATNNGDQTITLTQKANAAIEIVSKGPINVTAASNVTIKTDTGDVSIKGKSVTIEAQADLSLAAANVKIAAKAQAEMSANGSLKVSGQSAAELSSSGITQVQGSLVKIN